MEVVPSPNYQLFPYALFISRAKISTTPRFIPPRPDLSTLGSCILTSFSIVLPTESQAGRTPGLDPGLLSGQAASKAE